MGERARLIFSIFFLLSSTHVGPFRFSARSPSETGSVGWGGAKLARPRHFSSNVEHLPPNIFPGNVFLHAAGNGRTTKKKLRANTQLLFFFLVFGERLNDALK